VSPIEYELLQRYTEEALELAVELLRLWKTPSDKKIFINQIEKEAALQTAQGVFSLWENVPEELQGKLRDFKTYLVEIQKIKSGRLGEGTIKVEENDGAKD